MGVAARNNQEYSTGAPVSVDDLDVADVFEVPHPSGARWGRKIIYKHVEGLKLRDGTKRYGCDMCKNTYGNPVAVGAHQRRDHLNGASAAGAVKKRAERPVAAPAGAPAPARTRTASTASRRQPAPPAEHALTPVAAYGLHEAGLDKSVELVIQLSNSRNEWKARALAAERERDTMRKDIARLAAAFAPNPNGDSNA